MLTRLPISIGVAFVVTFGLFTLMQTLVEMSEASIDEYSKRKVIDFIRLKRDTSTAVKKRELPTRQRPKTPPKTPKIESSSAKGPGASAVSIAAPSIDTGLNLKGALKLGTAAADTEAIPVVRVAPMYPPHARARQIEGWVLVQFDVSPTGAVVNVRVLDAKPTGVFESAAKRTIQKWKYKPRVVNGKAVVNKGVKNRIVFKLDQ